MSEIVYDGEDAEELKQGLIDAAMALYRRGLLSGKEGNLSVKMPGERVLITPARKDYSALVPEDLVVLDLQGRKIGGQRSPSSELRMHIEIYRRRQDVEAIIHTHATYASILAVTHSKLPAVLDELTIALGGEIEVSHYAVPGTEELGRNVATALDGKKAAFIANHGCVAVGRSIDEAVENMIVLERASKVYVISKNFGFPKPLPEVAISKEIELYNS